MTTMNATPRPAHDYGFVQSWPPLCFSDCLAVRATIQVGGRGIQRIAKVTEANWRITERLLENSTGVWLEVYCMLIWRQVRRFLVLDLSTRALILYDAPLRTDIWKTSYLLWLTFKETKKPFMMVLKEIWSVWSLYLAEPWYLLENTLKYVFLWTMDSIKDWTVIKFTGFCLSLEDLHIHFIG